jgi:hypothetical protein
MREFVYTTSNALKKCRLCDVDINRNDVSVTLRGIRLKGDRVDIHFHPECIKTSLDNIKQETEK